MSPDVLLVASSVPIVVSISSAAPPIPSAALNVAVPVVTKLAASPAVLSVIAPVPSDNPVPTPSKSAVTFTSALVVTVLRSTLPSPRRVIFPFSDEIVEPSCINTSPSPANVAFRPF